MSEQPTQEQIKEFWEWCGFKIREYPHAFLITEPDGQEYESDDYPDIDLNNLYRYAVPFLLEKNTIIETFSFKQESGLYYSETCIWDRDERQLKGSLVSKAFVQDQNLEKANEQSVFWALQQVREEKNERK